MAFNEDTRVKIPAILHICKLGYEYLSLSNAVRDEGTNIFTDIFMDSLLRINPDIEKEDLKKVFEEVSLSLDNEDLGQYFYEKLTATSGIKLIDFKDFDNNSFHVVTELTCKNGDDEFRPDITLLINGMPLAFIEVKKPNNIEGVLAERNRINIRFQNNKFRKFINISQVLVFSNNMEYDPNVVEPIQGAFYASTSTGDIDFNYFREEEDLDLSVLLKSITEDTEDFVLKDNNLNIIKHSPEFITNKNSDTPTNRILTSLFNRSRLSFILRYGITYVKSETGIKKHIMRYPQVFATKAIERKIEDGTRKGIIWHTQGSGKTALAYYNVAYLTDYFKSKGIVPKFYFIVDRLDLLNQAKREFSSRGLIVHIVNSRDEFANDIKLSSAIHNNEGKAEITVVNIQKFKDDPDVVKRNDYNINIQRVYFLDEVHRSYNPTGSFLANLSSSDENAIKIGLTGTPLLGDDYNSRALFGNYIHKYYYNASIADGYTLRLIREEIETSYKIMLQKVLENIKVIQGNLDKREVYSHHKFVEPMLDYIIEDFEKSRIMHADNSIGGMVVCDSSDQAKMMFEIFKEKYAGEKKEEYEGIDIVAEPVVSYGSKHKTAMKVKIAALILHDVGTKDERKKLVEDFKDGKIDFLFVYNMLLTGFDASRLKKFYLGRVIKSHNLLQALTRVNRPYKKFRYGYVVDFADIKKEFDVTNKAYMDELQAELGDETEHYSNLFKSKEEIEVEIQEIKDVLFHYNTENSEIFSQQISEIQDRNKMLQILRVLGNARGLYNLIRLFGHYELLEKLDFKKLSTLYREASNHLNLLNMKEKVENATDSSNLLNIALEDLIFKFVKISEEELVLADELKNILQKTREALVDNFDKKDLRFVSLKEELERLFKKKNLSEITQEEMTANIGCLTKIFERIKELNREDNLLKEKYQHDKKYVRIHKRLIENQTISKKESTIFDALLGVKIKADEQVLHNNQLLSNEGYFDRMMTGYVVDQFQTRNGVKLTPDSTKYINKLVVNEYIKEFNGESEW
ncbi:MAG: DEAD/DEAH box helicase family protein [Candidatus Omnitrophica bacterium]|nr:DEAD/DEAH box helicase family protein [Candidatus Omnitrophota bacterium]